MWRQVTRVNCVHEEGSTCSLGEWRLCLYHLGMLLLSRTVDGRYDQMRKNMKCLASWFGILEYRKQAEILPCRCWRYLIGCPSIAHRWNMMTRMSNLESKCTLVKSGNMCSCGSWCRSLVMWRSRHNDCTNETMILLALKTI